MTPAQQYAAVQFEGDSRRVRRVVAGFVSATTAELYAIEQGWSDYAVGLSCSVVPAAF